MTDLELACGFLALSSSGLLILLLVVGLRLSHWKTRHDELQRRYFDLLNRTPRREWWVPCIVRDGDNVVPFRRTEWNRPL